MQRSILFWWRSSDSSCDELIPPLPGEVLFKSNIMPSILLATAMVKPLVGFPFQQCDSIVLSDV